MDDQIRGERVILRRPREADADDVLAAGNDGLIQRYLPELPRPYTREDALRWITEVSPAAFAAGGAGYVIADPGTDRLLGSARLGPPSEHTAEVGYWVAPWGRGRGVGTAAIGQLTAHTFERGLARLFIRTEPENTASQRVAIAAGYSRESVQRGAGVHPDGGRSDLIVWARLADDPPGPALRLLPDLPGYGGARGSGKLTDEVITLRPLTAGDAEDTFRVRQLDEVIRTSVPPVVPRFEEIRAKCERAESYWLAGLRAEFTIRDSATGGYAGEIALMYLEPSLQQAMLGYSIAPAWRRRGYATRAVRLVSDWSFGHTDILRLVAGTAPDNVGSQGVLAAAGFTREGLQRLRLPGFDGNRIDNVVFALIAPAAEAGTGQAPSQMTP